MKRSSGRYDPLLSAPTKGPAFVPAALPPHAPELVLDGKLLERLTEADAALRRLDLISHLIPSIEWLLYGFMRKEAVLSAQIDGNRSTLSALLRFEGEYEFMPDPPIEAVCNALDALSYGRLQIAKLDRPGLPLSFLRDLHRRLMRTGRKSATPAGQLRQGVQSTPEGRLSKAGYVPPPADLIPSLIDHVDRFLADDGSLPPLIQIGLAYGQIKLIEPFAEANGRLSRMVVQLLLERRGLLKSPLLYLSLFIKHRQEEYEARLSAIVSQGDWEGWLSFFLEGIIQVADDAVQSAQTLAALIGVDRNRILTQGQSTASSARLFELLPFHPVVTVAGASKLMEKSAPTSTRSIEVLVSLGILVEVTGRKRDRSFVYQTYIDQLRVGAEG